MALQVAHSAAAPAPPRSLVAEVERVDRALRTSAPPRTTRLGGMGAYHMGWVDSSGRPYSAAPGKMLRGGLCLWTCRALGGDPGAAMPAAVALEWAHNFTLVHDDIQDGDRERRGRPTVWTLFGSAQAINAGDGLHALAQRSLLAPGPRPARRLAAARALNDAVLTVIEGQCLDLALEGAGIPGLPTYLRLARAKTGALFGAAMECGALLAAAGTRTAAQLRAAGIALGAAFQVRDDWLGTFGDPTVTGKPRGGDLQRRKVTAVVTTAYAAANRSTRRLLRTLMAAGDDAAAECLLLLVHGLGAADRTATLAEELAATALGSGTACLPEASHDDLAALVAYAIARER